MRISPIAGVFRAVNPPHKAFMAIHHDKHTVVMDNGERHDLPAKEAWELLTATNKGIIV